MKPRSRAKRTQSLIAFSILKRIVMGETTLGDNSVDAVVTFSILKRIVMGETKASVEARSSAR